MSKQKLIMKYHPAKKEIFFQRFQNDQEVPIRNDSRLMYYMNMKGGFVLQDHGNAFFEDIAKAFDGLKQVDIQVITTKMDYEDFVQMVEYYNAESGSCKINPTLIAELPDMIRTFDEVKKHGEQAIAILHNHKQRLFEVPLESENIKSSAESFAKQIDDEIKNIRDKIKSLGDNNVNLCFTGVYSSGKSTIINAILGYKIMPEAINSETAKMFKIKSPADGEPVKIIFDLCSVKTELAWDEELHTFEFVKGPSESAIRTEIQKTINKNKEEQRFQHEYIYSILTDLNKRAEISSEIQIVFPIALDNDRLKFTIFDTPGTDRNYLAHQQVLTDALEEQRQSILIFVAKPDGLEGSGNNALLNYLKEAELKSSKTSIDIGRSLFVINKADGQTADARVVLQTQEIKNKEDEDFSIKLSNKKLFFTSANYAYVAKAVANGIATQSEMGMFEAGQTLLATEYIPMGYCFRQNKCATSEYATGKMIEKCERALGEAEIENNMAKKLLICSGLFALENEIVQYGEKFASAVKAYAIIDSVDKALSKLSNRANSLSLSNQEEIAKIEENIRQLRQTINQAIEKEYLEKTIPSNKQLPQEALKRLKLDSTTLHETIIGHTKTKLEKELKGWFLGLGKVRFKEKDKEKVENIINQVLLEFTKEFKINRRTLLTEQRDSFMEAVKQTIIRNGNISEAAKQFFLDIPTPDLTALEGFSNIDKLYNKHKKTTKILWMERMDLDKEGFIDDVVVQLQGLVEDMYNDYCSDYRNTLETLLMQIKSQFETNLAEYSVHMKALIDNKDIMMQLGKKVENAANALIRCQEELNEIIWRELSNS